ncbi:AAA family ATPase [Roseofilum reptotaenium CS-1145]|uniref:Excinuclease n=1 Tax=Roseofilum reptotaenium AO1-A TaxID=1925591 RepID=A0A1L9QN66_9CYAN|nr:AAA family ATPase [Roseofilum reptotaenium]MDB9519690.1 AAA family ATPase [Roseofilum reptotaenium CS-1145]OJJ24128.1 excinuclease [Roseofilum reptotaenium AO1-A]
MKIQQISITGLFGVFDHVIPLNQEDRITIIHGPNGFGKTSILRLIDGLFNAKYSVLNSIPFGTFKVDFDDGNTLEVSKKDIYHHPESTLCIVSSLSEEPFYPKSIKFNLEMPSEIVEDFLPEIKRISRDEWLYTPTNDILSLEEIIYRFAKYRIPQGFLKDIKNPEWLEKIQENIPVRLVKSQRLSSFYSYNNSEKINREFGMESTIVQYSQKLANSIQHARSEYGRVSQSLDRTFPVRLVKKESEPKFTKEELRDQLNRLEEYRSHLIGLGLLDRGENIELKISLKEIDESTQSVLSVYMKDMKRKLDVFQEIANKIELLRKVVNHKFKYSYKKIEFNQKDGFVVSLSDHPLSSDDNGKNLDLTELSSGEQHELVLLYELLFKVKPNTLVLIDEPELSLHVGWQSEFLQDLQDIIKLADIDILMATHSPDIIQDRWDWTVELKRPKS